MEADDGDIVGLLATAHPFDEFLIEEHALVGGRQLVDVEEHILEATHLELLMLGATKLVAIAVGEEVHHVARLTRDVLAMKNNLIVSALGSGVGTYGHTLTVELENLIATDNEHIVHRTSEVDTHLAMMDDADGHVHAIFNLICADFSKRLMQLSLEHGEDLPRIVDLLLHDDAVKMVDAEDGDEGTWDTVASTVGRDDERETITVVESVEVATDDVLGTV